MANPARSSGEEPDNQVNRSGWVSVICRAGGQMFLIIQVVTVFLVAVAMSLSLAHALELPGKMRLDRDTYVAVQGIYYPGFTYGGLGEGLGMVATLVLLLLTSSNSPAFWWTLVSFVALLAM